MPMRRWVAYPMSQQAPTPRQTKNVTRKGRSASLRPSRFVRCRVDMVAIRDIPSVFFDLCSLRSVAWDIGVKKDSVYSIAFGGQRCCQRMLQNSSLSWL